MTKKAALTQRLDVARDELAAAQIALCELQAFEEDHVDTANTHTAWRANRDTAQVEIDRLKQLVRKLENQAAAAETAERQKIQRKAEDEANRIASAAATVVERNLAEMARLARETICAIAEADLVVTKAQRSRSPDLPPIPTTEARIRSTPASDELLIAEETIERWTDEYGSPLSDEVAHRVVPMASNPHMGRLPSQSASGPIRVMLRPFRQQIVQPRLRGRAPPPLASELHVPALRAGDAPGWSPLQNYGPTSALQRLCELRSYSPPVIEPEVRLIPTSGVD